IISNATLSTSENIETKESLQFINPFQNELNFTSKEKIKSIEIYDETGRLVLEGKNSTLDTSALERGVYMIKITMQSNKVVSKKGIKN
ncbi:MAG: T9SS type A sorting domain-containing protein, partial [Chryseobacterium sp.]|nr:T9SS type A sorting domain-containing protein [Chryseobacterium sp.]